MANNALATDLDAILEKTTPLWESLHNNRLFITGGTGFIGSWLLESFVWANTKLKLNAQAIVLTRNISRFAIKCPHLANHEALKFYEADVRYFEFVSGQFSHIIHAATDVSMPANQNNPLLTLDTIIQGTKRILDFATYCNAKRFLLLSSGAVYGKQPSDLTHIPEDFSRHPFTGSTPAYALGKCTAEYMAELYNKQHGLDVVIARCFAFIGPYLPLDAKYAAGNFIQDGLQGKSLVVNGDGTPYRSYLYTSDLAIWLWTILFRGECLKSYNVGSDEAITILEFAQLIANHFKLPAGVKVMKTPSNDPPERYIPNIKRAQEELQLTPQVKLAEAIRLTTQWHLLKRINK